MHGRADGMLKIRRSRIFRFALSGVSEIYFGPGDSHLVLALRRNKPDRVPCTQYSVSEFHTGVVGSTLAGKQSHPMCPSVKVKLHINGYFVGSSFANLDSISIYNRASMICSTVIAAMTVHYHI
jgi:hypothetical protein